jgi:hypothetical protein
MNKLSFAATLALYGCSAAPQDVAARIDDEVVTWAEVDRSLAGLKGAVNPELRRSALLQLVEQKIALGAARRAGITVREEEVDETLRKEIHAVGGLEDYEKLLRLRAIGAAENRESIRLRILVRNLVLLRVRPEEVGEDEIRRYYETRKDTLGAATLEERRNDIRLLLESEKREAGRRRLRNELLRSVRLEPADLFEED